MALPNKVEYLIIGAGVHGLSTAYHLGKYLKEKGQGEGNNILVLDKTGIAAGASGVACGNVRCNYYQEPMTNLMIHCMDIWESDPDYFAYNSVGYLTASFAPMAEGLAAVYERHQSLGYPSTFIEGENKVKKYMQSIFHDWQAEKLEVVLHEHRGGHAWSKQAIHGLGIKAEGVDARLMTGVKVTGFDIAGDGSVTVVHTDIGRVEVGAVVVAVGPWIKQLWDMLELPREVPDPRHPDQMTDLWHYLALQEGEIEINPYIHITNDGQRPPLVHVDSDVPLFSEDGRLVWDQPWGIYFKRDKHSVQGGAVPLDVGLECELDPYGTRSPHYCVDDQFYDLWVASLAHCMKRYEGTRQYASKKPSGGVGAFSADNFPVFDFVRPNVYAIADSNHGFKMIGVGEQVARILTGEGSELLAPFAYSRFANRETLPRSNAPFPWM
ncbi:MAG: FAD-dependent oxidoreductase [Chloroflexi bacterium]|jgi:glycine/D-amino acid oxidase-like deaminating enzyme|nr:FAD-dependent oxidoreductase [Chloroflexota bacterium]